MLESDYEVIQAMAKTFRYPELREDVIAEAAVLLCEGHTPEAAYRKARSLYTAIARRAANTGSLEELGEAWGELDLSPLPVPSVSAGAIRTQDARAGAHATPKEAARGIEELEKGYAFLRTVTRNLSDRNVISTNPDDLALDVTLLPAEVGAAATDILCSATAPELVELHSHASVRAARRWLNNYHRALRYDQL